VKVPARKDRAVVLENRAGIIAFLHFWKTGKTNGTFESILDEFHGILNFMGF
jgi:hypothetical protein